MAQEIQLRRKYVTPSAKKQKSGHNNSGGIRSAKRGPAGPKSPQAPAKVMVLLPSGKHRMLTREQAGW